MGALLFGTLVLILMNYWFIWIPLLFIIIGMICDCVDIGIAAAIAVFILGTLIYCYDRITNKDNHD